MPIKKYFANSDNVINNTYKSSTTNSRNSGSNAGVSDIIELYSLYNRRGLGGTRNSKIANQFSIADIAADRTSGDIPASGSVTFGLKLYNAKHYYRRHSITIYKSPLFRFLGRKASGSDLEDYSHETKDQLGSNWIKRAGATSWTTPGGDYHTDASSSFTKTITGKTDDLEIDVTALVEQWITGSSGGGKNNYGFIVKLADEFEAYHSSSTGTFSGSILHNPNGSTKSYYRKMLLEEVRSSSLNALQ